MQKKEVNEKTFELNITNELLNLSTSFMWYLNHQNLHHLQRKNILPKFMNQPILFAEGLTQEEESNKTTGGYDVSINSISANGQETRVFFLQYKAGVRMGFSTNIKSKFYKKTAKLNKTDPKHAMFIFNDAALGTQHSTLRSLANKNGISPQSVLYVFPRITEKTEFKNKIGVLRNNSSFVPVLELDRQSLLPPNSAAITDGVTHKYRTSYDGQVSEVNFFFFFFNYDKNIVPSIIAELISIQIERLARLLQALDSSFWETFMPDLIKAVREDYNQQVISYNPINSPLQGIITYIENITNRIGANDEIPKAPSLSLELSEAF